MEGWPRTPPLRERRRPDGLHRPRP
jgi:hypothetical protein